MTLPKMHEILGILFSEDECIEFLIREEIVETLSICSACGGAVSRYSKRWECTRYSCKKVVSIFKNTFFAGSRIKCNEIMHMGYLWLTGCSAKTIAMHTGHSEHTISDYLGFFRQLTCNMIEDDEVVIGGQNIVVQVDETKMGKIKYHRGHRVEGAWVIVGVEKTESRRVFAEVVEDRSEGTIVEVLSRHICEGSILWTDKWKGYHNLSRIFNIQHETVNHSLTFKDPVTGVNTNTVEGTNFALKRAVPPRNRTRKTLPSFLSEFVWRRKCTDTLWESFIGALKETLY